MRELRRVEKKEKREERKESKESKESKERKERARKRGLLGFSVIRIIPRFVQHTGELTTQSTPIAGQKY